VPPGRNALDPRGLRDRRPDPRQEHLRPQAPAVAQNLARIYAGAVKFRWPEPLLVILRNHMNAQSVEEPLPTLCAGGTHVGLAQPFLLNRHGDNGATRAHDLSEPMPTADCRGAGYLCEPFVATVALGCGSEPDPHSRRCKTIDEPLQTIHAGGNKFALVEPFIMSGQSGGAPREIAEPIPGMTGRLGSALIAALLRQRQWRDLRNRRAATADRHDQSAVRSCDAGYARR
jgi:DNA (cytosine-5)-methyltransferase 1